jgi:hypothetical protein
LTFFPKAYVYAGAFIALLLAPTALARPTSISGPGFTVEGQRVNNVVVLALIVIPSNSTPKPGVVVTLTNCKQGQRAPIRLVRRIGRLGPNQSLSAHPGKIVWTVGTVPARPTKPTLRLRLALPAGTTRFCAFASMHDTYTKTTTNIKTRVPL